MAILGEALGVIMFVVAVVAVMVGCVGLWLAARKAGLLGFGVGAPHPSAFTLIRMAGLEKEKIPWFALPLGLALLCRVPFGIARRFGKGRLFGLGLLLLPFVFFPILGFGRARYSLVTTSARHGEEAPGSPGDRRFS